MPYEYLKPLLRENGSKIVLLILDGLGGLPLVDGGKTELETAHTPNLDRLASEGALGRSVPIRTGITPGSGPAHLALFGFDPLSYVIGRGALSAVGIGMELNPGDIAVRGNFCSLDENGLITDRRAGRIGTETAIPLVERLDRIEIDGVSIEVKPVKEYRFTVVMRGAGLDEGLMDTDPQVTGKPPHPVISKRPAAEATAALYREFVEKAQAALADQPKANGIILRGFATDPGLPSYRESYGLRAACIAVYPMYKGVSRLAGMDVIKFEGEYPADEFRALAGAWDDYDFFFVHIKKTDSMGEDGNFEGKAGIIESVDEALPRLMELNPDVLMVTGDHSTPAKMRSHSWHPVPFLMWAPERHLQDSTVSFGERACMAGGLGTFPATDVMSMALAHAGRLDKFGA